MRSGFGEYVNAIVVGIAFGLLPWIAALAWVSASNKFRLDDIESQLKQGCPCQCKQSCDTPCVEESQ